MKSFQFLLILIISFVVLTSCKDPGTKLRKRENDHSSSKSPVNILGSITYPAKNQSEWDGGVKGVGCKPGDKIEVFIKTDIDYLQGTVTADANGKWELKKTYLTKGKRNVFFARISRGNEVVGETDKVIIYP